VRTVTPLRAVFVNENIGGHTTVHAALRRCFAECTDVQAEFLDAPAPGRLGRVLRAPAPGLSRFDADLQPLRAQLVRSEWVRRALRERLRQGGVDAVHVYTQNCALTSAGLLRTVPTVITTDSTTVLNAYRIPYRAPARFTPWSVRANVPLERRALHTAYRVIANSRYAADSLRTHYGVPAGALEVLAFGVWLPSEPAPRTDAATRRPAVAFIGHQLERKGGRRLIEAHQQHLRERCDLVLITSEQVEPLPGVRVVSGISAGSDRLWEVLLRSTSCVSQHHRPGAQRGARGGRGRAAGDRASRRRHRRDGAAQRDGPAGAPGRPGRAVRRPHHPARRPRARPATGTRRARPRRRPLRHAGRGCSAGGGAG